MRQADFFSNSIYLDQEHLAGRELFGFMLAVTELYGPAEARTSSEEWLHEAELLDMPPRSEIRDWRAITISASARLALRIEAALHRRSVLPVPTSSELSRDLLSVRTLRSQ